jgi:hypothetical protein
MSGLLFEDDFGVDESPKDDTQITTTILYFSEEELKEFKKLCKQGMKTTYGAEAATKANLSDYLLKTLRNANHNS